MCSKKKKKEGKYVHRIYLRRIILAALLTFCVIYFGSTVAMMMYFQGAHLDEFLTFSQLTLIHIRSQTVAELKQNEIQLVHSDLKSTAESIQDLEPEDLVQYGLIPEFVGRLPVIATLEELDVPALVQILTEPKNALTKQYRKMFDMEGVEIDFRDDGLRAVAERAMERKTGARGLRSILENVLLDSMYNIPSQADVAKIVIDESVIKGESEPLLVYQSQDMAKAAADE